MRNSIDERIVKIRPMSTPIDQLSRCGLSRHAGAMTVEYYSVDTKQTETVLAEAAAGGAGRQRSENVWSHVIKTDADNIFDISETILVPEVNGFDASGNEAGPLVLYVLGKPEGGGIEVAPVNGKETVTMGQSKITMPAMATGTRLVRMGRAATELDVQSPQFSALPRKASNNCQIFKMQVEQSTLARIADKEVGWNFSDQEEAAIIDMRLGMEKNFIFGSRAKLFDPEKNEDVYFTGGIWGQTERDYKLPVDGLTEHHLVSLCRAAFTGNNGSKRKILLAGSALMEALSKLEYSKIVRSGETRQVGHRAQGVCVEFWHSLRTPQRGLRPVRPRGRRLYHRPQLHDQVCACALPGRETRPAQVGAAQHRRRGAYRGFVPGAALSGGPSPCHRCRG